MNHVRDIKTYLPKEGEPDGPRAWRNCRKGVADLHRAAEVRRSSMTKPYCMGRGTVAKRRGPRQDTTQVDPTESAIASRPAATMAALDLPFGDVLCRKSLG